MIYDFEQHKPPHLTEKMLREELKRRELKKQAILLCTASILMYICLILFAILISPIHMVLAMGCIAIVCFSIISNGIISIVFLYHQKRRFLI